MGKWLGNTPKFQSTLRRTERHLAEILDSILVEFQSTLRRTERHEVISGKYGNEPISIHAPTNGATVLCGLSYHRLIYFNPRSDERSDVVKCGVQYRGCAFQSTLRRTERLLLVSTFCDSTNISIHAPTNGATGWGLTCHRRLCISIHAPTNGATITTNT